MIQSFEKKLLTKHAIANKWFINKTAYRTSTNDSHYP